MRCVVVASGERRGNAESRSLTPSRFSASGRVRDDMVGGGAIVMPTKLAEAGWTEVCRKKEGARMKIEHRKACAEPIVPSNRPTLCCAQLQRTQAQRMGHPMNPLIQAEGQSSVGMPASFNRRINSCRLCFVREAAPSSAMTPFSPTAATSP